MVELTHVVKTFGRHVALNDVSLRIKHGEAVAIVGPNGCGKSTLLRLIMMQELPTRGIVTVGQWSSQNMSTRRVSELRRRIGVLYQDFRLLRDRSVFDNVALPLYVSGQLTTADVDKRVRDALSSVGLSDRGTWRPSYLSGAEQQRAALARALVTRPALLLADEPTGNLDAPTGEGILDLLASLPESGTAVVLATYDVAIAERIRARTIRMEHGRFIDDNPVIDLVESGASAGTPPSRPE
jgi:cell division transport system ATP-binding protein